ncbi:MAG: diacylglycerol kinase family protein [Flavobacteriales bacterium]|nr:diacylglycerol kinase family protein [Flavobacteriales bacterium]
MSFYFAFQGIHAFFKSQQNMYIHLLAALLSISLGFGFKISKFEWIAVVLCIVLVFVTEMLNSALEVLVDMVSPEWSEKAKYIKDVSAAAVLFMAIGTAITGGIIFLPYIINIF